MIVRGAIRGSNSRRRHDQCNKRAITFRNDLVACAVKLQQEWRGFSLDFRRDRCYLPVTVFEGLVW